MFCFVGFCFLLSDTDFVLFFGVPGFVLGPSGLMAFLNLGTCAVSVLSGTGARTAGHPLGLGPVAFGVV